MKMTSATQPSLRRAVAEHGGIVDHRMPAAQPQQNHRPDRPAQPELAERQHQQADGPAHHLMAPRKERVENVAAIQLPDRQQIHRRGEHAHPGCARHRVKVDIARRRRRENGVLQQPLQAGDAELHAALVRDAGDHFRECDAHRQRGHQEDEARQRPGDSDVEERALGIDRRADADEGAEGSQERRGQEVRQAGVHLVEDGGDVVAELVSQQNRQESEGRREALRAAAGWRQNKATEVQAVLHVERHVAFEIALHRRTHQAGGDQRECKQKGIEPVALSRAGRRNGDVRAPSRFRDSPGTAQEKNPGVTR